MKMKKCPRCGWNLPLSLFHKDQSRPDGHYSYCKKCNYQNTRKYIGKNTEYYLEYQKKYKEKNPEKIKKLKIDWGNKNRKKHIKNATEWNKKNFDKVTERRLQKNFGISLSEYNKMNLKQNGMCAICGKRNINGKKLYVDHDHKTGIVRDLLCINCNMAIGGFNDDVNLMLSAIEYIKKHTAPMIREKQHEKQIAEALK